MDKIMEQLQEYRQKKIKEYYRANSQAIRRKLWKDKLNSLRDNKD